MLFDTNSVCGTGVAPNLEYAALKEAHFRRAQEERERATAWLVPFMDNGQPKFATKADLCAEAMKTLGVSKSTFECAWVWAIERTGRFDWYEPLRRGRKGHKGQ